MSKLNLVGGLEHQFYFPIYIGLLIIPIDFHIFQRVAQPPTRNGGFSNKQCLIAEGQSDNPPKDRTGSVDHPFGA